MVRAGRGLFALLAIAAWAALEWLVGLAAAWAAGWSGNCHEVPFGFGLAIIAGFLLTAVQTWTPASPACCPVGR